MILDIKNVGKVYGSGHTAVNSLRDVSLSVDTGEIILIIGPSGSGKTTLLSIIGTLLRPSSGKVSYFDKPLEKASEKDLNELRLHQIGFVFQNFNLLAALSAQQNVMVPLLASGVSKNKAQEKSTKILKTLQLGERLNNLPKQLSGGEKQRVAIARALVNEPQLILADEPTANLDSRTGTEVMEILCGIACKEKKAVIVVSHDMRLAHIAKRVITIEDGELVKEETGGHDGYCKMQH